MKILKKGTFPKPSQLKVYRGECPICQCQIEIWNDEEGFHTVADTHDTYVLCPTTGCPQVRLFVKEYITRQITPINLKKIEDKFEDKSDCY